MERLKLLTLNIWNRQGPWERRRDLIRDGLRELAPDIVALQEVLSLASSNQAEELASGLGYEVALFPSWDLGGGLNLGNAVLSRFPIERTERFELPGAEPREQRCLGFAAVAAPCGEVPVFATHLNWKLHHGHIRCEQVKLIADRVRALSPTNGFPPVLMGDFNAEPDSDEIRYVRGLTPLGGRSFYMCDAWESCGEGPGHTYSRDNDYALRTREPSRRIDYIFVRGPDRQLRGEPLAARRVFDRALDGVWPSDHFGVYAEIAAAPRTLDPL